MPRPTTELEGELKVTFISLSHFVCIGCSHIKVSGFFQLDSFPAQVECVINESENITQCGHMK